MENDLLGVKRFIGVISNTFSYQTNEKQ